MFEKAIVSGEDEVVKCGIVEPPCVSDVVDADPEGEEGVASGPGGGGAIGWEIEFLDLVFE